MLGSRYIRVVYGSLSHLGERFAKVTLRGLTEAKPILTREDGFTTARKACGPK